MPSSSTASYGGRGYELRPIKIACGLVCIAFFASNVWTMSRWTERRGVFDDICYLRQAHLFQRFGLDGIRTDIARDDDRFFANAQRDIGYPGWSDPAKAACHVDMPATGARVLQYPPGPGFALSLYPEGFQVVPLYATATAIVLAMALVAIALATTAQALGVAALFGWAALYFMVNPTKSSYSLPPTMVICAVAGYLTVLMSTSPDRKIRLLTAAATGLALGLAVNFRIPNLVLGAGYALVLGGAFLMRRSVETFVQGAVFAAALLIGLAPTLIANAFNAGHPFRTTYGGADVAGPAFDAGVILQYAANLQGVLALLAMAGVVALLVRVRADGIRQAVAIVGCNLAVNLVFFLSHPIYTPYYLMPIMMLSLWTLLFTYLAAGRSAAQTMSAA